MMKKNNLLVGTVLIIASIVITACSKTATPPPEAPVNAWDTITQFQGCLVPQEGKISVSLEHKFNGNTLQTGSTLYTTAGGDTISVAELRYYIGHFRLSKPDGSNVLLNQYELINDAVSSSKRFVISNVPPGIYSGLSFVIGVDSVNNHSGLQEGALDPARGMFWTWNTGYVFFRINGNAGGSGKKYSFDLGGDNNLVKIQSNLNSWKIKSVNPTVNLTMNLEEMFQHTDTVRFSVDGYDVHDALTPLGHKLAKNMGNMMVIQSIEP